MLNIALFRFLVAVVFSVYSPPPFIYIYLAAAAAAFWYYDSCYLAAIFFLAVDDVFRALTWFYLRQAVLPAFPVEIPHHLRRPRYEPQDSSVFDLAIRHALDDSESASFNGFICLFLAHIVRYWFPVVDDLVPLCLEYGLVIYALIFSARFVYSLRMFPVILASDLVTSWWRALRSIVSHVWVVLIVFLAWVFIMYGTQPIVGLLSYVGKASLRRTGDTLLQVSDALMDVAGPQFERNGVDVNVLERDHDGIYTNVIYRTVW